MKIRLDFVTNSSSSSFLIAKKGEGYISPESRNKIADLLIDRYLAHMQPIDDVTVENIAEHDDFERRRDDIIEAGKSALKDGYKIMEGYINYDETDIQLASILDNMFKILKDEEDYRIIDDDLSY